MRTLKTFDQKLSFLQNRAWLPPALLLLALSSVFLFGDDQRSYFYKHRIHTEMSAKNLAIADNLSPEHHFLMFHGETLDADGRHTYEAYNRFPIGSYALIKLAILPFGDDLSDKISSALMLMLLFFAAAAFMAYLSLRRLTSSRWIALTAALLAFASPYPLYFNDVIASEASVDIFGALLVFHGMAVFEQDGRFRQLLLKTCIVLFLGWHVYALLLPYIAFGVMRELFRARSPASTPSLLCQLKRATFSLTHSRYLTLGVAALLFGASLLTFNLTNEYFALNRETRETRFTETPSFRSMLLRTRIGSEARADWYAKHLELQLFWKRQFYRVGAMSLPYAFSSSFVARDTKLPSLFIIYGVAAFGASLIGLLFILRHKILLASLTLSGFCWALPMRYSVGFPWHSHEAVFYIGVALTLFSLVLLFLRRLSDERLIAALSVIAALVFVVSALRMTQINDPEKTEVFHKAAIADFEAIRSITDDDNLIQTATMPHGLQWFRIIDYYLSGRFVIAGHETASSARPFDFVVSGLRLDGLASLTPQNQMAFLYEWDDYHRHIDEIIEAQTDEPLTRHGFDVYRVGNALMYAKDACREDDVAEKFFVALYPVHESDLSDARKPHGFHNNLDFHFHDIFHSRFVRSGERCVALAPLPDYDIAHIYTGQRIQRAGSTAHSWASGLIDGKMRSIDEIIEQAGEPLIRSNFDVHFDGSALIYLKDACSEDDISEKFFLGIYPVDEIDLPANRKQHGFDNLDFRFEDQVIQSGARCIAIKPLPEYDIARIHTGQYIKLPDGSFEHPWMGEIRVAK